MSHWRISSNPNPALRGWGFAPGVPTPNLWYRLWRRAFQVGFAALWHVRVFNRCVEPVRGPVVYISNHQSYLDPILMTMGLLRPCSYMARASLFKPPGFGPLIRSLNAFPVDRDQVDMSAMKEAIARAKAGGQVVIYAEGTRTLDGRIAPLLPIAALPARRAGATIIPVVIDGAYECWPRTQILPSPGHITVQYGQPIAPEIAKAVDGSELMRRIRAEMIEIQHHMRLRTGRRPFEYAE